MSYISEIHARQILDSRGNPTVEVDVITDNGHMGRAAGLADKYPGPRLVATDRGLQRPFRPVVRHARRLVVPRLRGH